MRAPESLEVTLGPSRLLAAWIVGWFGATAALVWTLPVDPWWAAVLSDICLVLGAWQLRVTALRRGRRAWRTMRVSEDRSASIRFGDGSCATGTLAPTTYVGERLVAIHVRASDRRALQSTLILPDTTGDSEFRRLKVLLRLSAPRRAPSRAGAGAAGASGLARSRERG